MSTIFYILLFVILALIAAGLTWYIVDQLGQPKKERSDED